MTQWGLDTLFNPAKRHMDEEKRRLQATRQQVGDTSGGKRIDLESGKVRIPKAAHADESDDVADDAVATDDPVEGSEQAEATEAPAAPKRPAAKRSAAGKRAEGELSPAQIRAAERRGRKPR